MAIETFNRVECKYLLTNEDVKELLPILNQYMESDKFNRNGETYPISNLYFDTSADELIIKSLEKPIYKEKLRLRSYGQVDLDDTVFLEIKKKYDGVVYKRRTPFKLREAYDFIYNGTIPKYEKTNWQVFNEIQDFMNRYDLIPKVFISYDRLAFFEKNNSDFRLTLDSNIKTHRNNLRLDIPIFGNELLEENQWLMEAKAFKAFPLWFVHFISKRKINKTSFSKYGNEYKKYQCQKNN